MVYKKNHPFRTMLRHYCLMRDLYTQYKPFVDNTWYARLFQMNDPQVELFRDYFSFVDDTFSNHYEQRCIKHPRELKTNLSWLRHLIDLWIIKYEHLEQSVDDILNFNLLKCEKLVYDREQHLKNLLSSPREIIDPIDKYHSILNRQQASTNREMFQLR